MLLSSNPVHKYPTIFKIKCFNNNDKLMSWKEAVEKKFSHTQNPPQIILMSSGINVFNLKRKPDGSCWAFCDLDNKSSQEVRGKNSIVRELQVLTLIPPLSISRGNYLPFTHCACILRPEGLQIGKALLLTSTQQLCENEFQTLNQRKLDI